MAYDLIAEIPKQEVCRNRQAGALNRWSKTKMAEAIPGSKPAKEWVQQRIVAGRIPASIDSYVQRTMAYTQRDTDIQTNIREHLNGFNNETVEVSMDMQVDTAVGKFMPEFCTTDVMQQQIDQWYLDNGFAEAL